MCVCAEVKGSLSHHSYRPTGEGPTGKNQLYNSRGPTVARCSQLATAKSPGDSSTLYINRSIQLLLLPGAFSLKLLLTLVFLGRLNFIIIISNGSVEINFTFVFVELSCSKLSRCELAVASCLITNLVVSVCPTAACCRRGMSAGRKEKLPSHLGCQVLKTGSQILLMDLGQTLYTASKAQPPKKFLPQP